MNATLAKLTRLTAEPAATDGPLLDAFLAGDSGAFAAIVRRYAALVFATCRRVLRHHQDAEDAFQATFLVLARRAADVWPRDAVGSWLFGVAHRVALKARSVRSRRQIREQPLEDVASTAPSPPDFDLAETIHRAILKLPEKYKAAVVACDLQGLTRKAAAERLGWSEGTLSGRLARARALLAARLKRLGLSLPASGLVAVFGTQETVSAVVESTLQSATGTAASVSAPVAALTEGVVGSMALFKLKTMAVALLTAGAIGFGVFAATGSGNTDGPPVPYTPPQSLDTRTTALQPVPPPPKPPAKPATDLELLQGKWRVVSIAEGGKRAPTNAKDPWVFEISGTTMKMPYKDATSGWKQREYKIIMPNDQPKSINLYAPGEPIAAGIYELAGTASTCLQCHQFPYSDTTDLPLGELFGLCEPAHQKATYTGWRLALSVEGKRPTSFGGEGVIVFTLSRLDPLADDQARLLDALKRLEARRLAAKTDITKAQLDSDIAMIRAKLEEAKATQAFRLAEREVERAKLQLDHAQLQVEVAKAQLESASKNLKLAQDKLDALKKAGGAKLNPKASYTIHIRTRMEPEQVVTSSTATNPTVLDALLSVANRVTVKVDAVTVWVVRDKTLVPVDLAAVLKGTDAKANFALKPGDQLFVQVKAEK
ncbi:MAG: sigma-70 family RNA polymerase sigma factor [Planctomycetia bacterium]|nr:sigma-70 family RNA polymerase sigma factor [Planctomycetia bacterium]